MPGRDLHRQGDGDRRAGQRGFAQRHRARRIRQPRPQAAARHVRRRHRHHRRAGGSADACRAPRSSTASTATTSSSSCRRPSRATASIVERRFVRLGATRGERIAVVDGLKVGDKVVIAGQIKLQPNSPVVDRPGRRLAAAGRNAEAVKAADERLHRSLHPPAGAGDRRQPADPDHRRRRRLQAADPPVSR